MFSPKRARLRSIVLVFERIAEGCGTRAPMLIHRRNDRPVRRPSLVYCNRTLNFRSVKAIGYDMDYTLVDYHVAAWEQLAFDKAKHRLLQLGWPVEQLAFDPQSVIRGLAIDTQTGNIVKANRFGFVHKSVHGSEKSFLTRKTRHFMGARS